jgi:hypothetical protein
MTGVFPRANNPGTLAVFLQANTAITWNLLIRRKATPIFSLYTGPARVDQTGRQHHIDRK